jgi:N utilization substance protein B
MVADVDREAAARPDVDTSRRRARVAALQMLYQSEIGRVPIEDVCGGFWDGQSAGRPPSAAVREFATRLATGVVAHREEIDARIAAAAEHWRIERMHTIDRLILRLAAYEFVYEPMAPAKVVINEALELARTFSTDESVRFANGVLDAVRRALGRE